LGNGALSTATVTLRINGVDDLAVITGDDTGSVKEEFDLTDTGTLSIFDPDSGQIASFIAHDSTNPLPGSHGSLVIDADGDWTYTLDNTDPLVQALTASQHRYSHRPSYGRRHARHHHRYRWHERVSLFWESCHSACG
jgi:hypothetical protein